MTSCLFGRHTGCSSAASVRTCPRNASAVLSSLVSTALCRGSRPPVTSAHAVAVARSRRAGVTSRCAPQLRSPPRTSPRFPRAEAGRSIVLEMAAGMHCDQSGVPKITPNNFLKMHLKSPQPQICLAAQPHVCTSTASPFCATVFPRARLFFSFGITPCGGSSRPWP